MSDQARPARRSPAPSWAAYRQTIGDRSGLFAALRREWAPARALYPGSYLDVSPSTAIPSVTYVDTDRRAARYFADVEHVTDELRPHEGPDTKPDVGFLHADYTTQLPLPAAGFDLLISLYAGLVWDHCRQYVAPEGLLLANTSHGDACVAALDPCLLLVGAVQHRGDAYRLDLDALDTYLVPKKPELAVPDLIRQRGRGIVYTRTAFAYVFRLSQPDDAAPSGGPGR